MTQREYAAFIQQTKRAPPRISGVEWKNARLIHDYDKHVRRFNWQGQRFPSGRADHPVVLVTHADARAYCAYRGQLVGKGRRLPTKLEFEKAARGANGRIYPWGNEYEPTRLNSADNGPYDTVPAGSIANGASPYGVLDAAGNVFQWTSSVDGDEKYFVKGSSWDDHGGVGRGASEHSRPATLRHIIIGFRCAGD